MGFKLKALIAYKWSLTVLINTMKNYKEMTKEPIYKETVCIYDEFKDAMGIQEW